MIHNNEEIVYSVIYHWNNDPRVDMWLTLTQTLLICHIISQAYNGRTDNRTKEERRSFLLSHHIYGWVIHFGKRWRTIFLSHKQKERREKWKTKERNTNACFCYLLTIYEVGIAFLQEGTISLWHTDDSCLMTVENYVM